MDHTYRHLATQDRNRYIHRTQTDCKRERQGDRRTQETDGRWAAGVTAASGEVGTTAQTTQHTETLNVQSSSKFRLILQSIDSTFQPEWHA